ncbi:MAG TPA: hypothetical protein VMI32_07030 [Candidatus Solibacter sp.]|nr:hypothetical protein [Candidatus Solibacter sp.]
MDNQQDTLDKVSNADAGRKGGQRAQANRRAREEALHELEMVLLGRANTPEKKCLVPILMRDYRAILEAGIRRPRTGKRAPSKPCLSGKALSNVTTRFLTTLWRLGAFPHAGGNIRARYKRRSDAPTEAAWRAEIRQRQWESLNQ